MNGDNPNHSDIWEAVNQTRLELAEIKGMIGMHFKDATHHTPPCKIAGDVQKTMLSAVGAAVLALMAAVGALILELIRK